MNTAAAADGELKALAAAARAEAKAGERGGLTLWDIFWDDMDDNLTRHRRRCERQIEDGVNPREQLRLERELAMIRYVKLLRWALRLRYGAHRLGTNSWDRYYRFGERPSLTLARDIDRYRWQHGFPHIIDWTFQSITTLGQHRAECRVAA